MARLISVLSSALVIGLSVIVLLGLLVGDDLGWLSPVVSGLQIRPITGILLQVVSITIAMTILIGVLNLLTVHLRRIIARRNGWFNSIVLIISFALVVGLTVLERTSGDTALSHTTILLEQVQFSAEAALSALVLFALVYGAYRLMRHKVTWGGMLFTVVVLVVLIGALPLQNALVTLSSTISDWLMIVPVSAGARGILLGIALATVVTAIRVFTGQDRSYRE